MYADPTGNMPEWAYWAISGGLIALGVGLVILSGGATIGPTTSLLASTFSGAFVSAGASSLITGYLNGENGGSFEAGYLGGMIIGAISGAAAELGGALIGKAVDACYATGVTLGQYLGGMGISFVGGTLGSFIGGLVTSKIDGREINRDVLLLTSIVSGGINLVGGYLSGAFGSLMSSSDISLKVVSACSIGFIESLSQVSNYGINKYIIERI